MSSFKNYKSKKRSTQAKILTVEQNQDGKLSANISHSILKFRFKRYDLIPGSYSERCLIKYIEQNEWTANYDLDTLSITRQVSIDKIKINR